MQLRMFTTPSKFILIVSSGYLLEIVAIGRAARLTITFGFSCLKKLLMKS